ncbi:MAG: LPS export ABC transporter periplasmic protein LptC [Deltaproteobacteria bacterium]|nr:LPS export ABC transporter periplasmic protein LptC [Deltaproteobacteria bacterium]
MTLLFVFIFLLVGAMLFALFFGNPQPEDSEEQEGVESGVVAEMADVHFTANSEHGVLWELKAESAVKDTLGKIRLKAVNFKYKKSDGNPILISGNNALIDEKIKDIFVEGNVVGSGADGYRIFADNILYNIDKMVISTDSGVRIEGEKVVVEGSELIYSVNDNNLKVFGDVRTVIQGVGLEPAGVTEGVRGIENGS